MKSYLPVLCTEIGLMWDGSILSIKPTKICWRIRFPKRMAVEYAKMATGPLNREVWKVDWRGLEVRLIKPVRTFLGWNAHRYGESIAACRVARYHRQMLAARQRMALPALPEKG